MHTDTAAAYSLGRSPARAHGLGPAVIQPYAALVCRLTISNPAVHVIARITTHLPTTRDGRLSWPSRLTITYSLPTPVNHRSDTGKGKRYSPNSTWLVTSRHVTTRSTCRAHAFWLCRACRTAQLDTLVSTRSTRRTCRVVSRRDVTSQVEFGLMPAITDVLTSEPRKRI